jgi:hypothetical protein
MTIHKRKLQWLGCGSARHHLQTPPHLSQGRLLMGDVTYNHVYGSGVTGDVTLRHCNSDASPTKPSDGPSATPADAADAAMRRLLASIQENVDPNAPMDPEASPTGEAASSLPLPQRFRSLRQGRSTSRRAPALECPFARSTQPTSERGCRETAPGEAWICVVDQFGGRAVSASLQLQGPPPSPAVPTPPTNEESVRILNPKP